MIHALCVGVLLTGAVVTVATVGAHLIVVAGEKVRDAIDRALTAPLPDCCPHPIPDDDVYDQETDTDDWRAWELQLRGEQA